MTAHHFLITRLDTGALVGHALICVEARYVSVRWKDAERLDRRFAGPPTWRSVEADLGLGWSRGYVDSGSMTYRLLVPQMQWGMLALQLMAQVPFDSGAHGAAAASACDTYLGQQAWR